MGSLGWTLRTTDGFLIASPIVIVLLVLMLLCWDYPLLLLLRLTQRAFAVSRHRRDAEARALPLLVVIPSLLRRGDELTSMMRTTESVAENGYPAPLTIVLTIDGTRAAPALYAALQQWAAGARFSGGACLFVTGTDERRGKPMAIDHAMGFVRGLVADGVLPAFPPVYVSTDADADLGASALERIVRRLQRRNRITGWPARVVAGALHVRGDDFWRGWRHFFSVEGQLNLQVAREYYVGNIWRYNVRWLPITGVPGAFYCTWSAIFLQIPRFMGYQRTLTRRDWLAWWLGRAPPRFADSVAAPIPELMAGDTDDTVTAYVASFAQLREGRFSLELPRTPLHALWYMLRSLFVDRALQFEPDAHVFTSSPTAPRVLFRQRKRWNSSRVELTGRFWKVLGYHWALGLPVTIVKLLIARTIIVGFLAYLAVPAVLWRSHGLLAFVLGYAGNVITFAVMTGFALAINGDARYWRLLLALPLAPAYHFLFNWIPGTVGVTSDVLLLGNKTGFSPERTLLRGGSARIALLFRLRRCAALVLRSLRYGDVPLGSFWLGFRETEWTPSGFEGWSTRRPRAVRAPPALKAERSRAR